jgi:predicted ATPase
MVIMTKRSVEMGAPNHPLRKLVSELLTHHLCSEIALAPLSAADVAEYLGGESGASLPEGFAELIYRYSEGNPLFMSAALDHMTEHGSIAREAGKWRLQVPLQEIDLGVPEILRQMIEAHIHHLTAEEQRVLEAASVAGVSFSANALAAVLQQGAEFVEEILENLSRRSLIVHSAGARQLPDASTARAFKFIHALYREVFYGRLTPVRRACICRRIGDSSRPLREVTESAANRFALGSVGSDPALETGGQGRVATTAAPFA